MIAGPILKDYNKSDISPSKENKCCVKTMSIKEMPVALRDEKVILVDMDGVIADFELQFLRLWRKRHPEAKWLPIMNRRSHYTDMDPSKVYDKARTHAILGNAEELYATMPAIEGAIEALKEMDKNPKLNIKICTAPFGQGEVRKRCTDAKRKWIRKHLGSKWLSTEKFICVKDKVQVPGDILVDDKPNPCKHWRILSAKSSAAWKHVVFTQPFNKKHKSCQSKPRLNHWSKWKAVLLPVLSGRL